MNEYLKKLNSLTTEELKEEKLKLEKEKLEITKGIKKIRRILRSRRDKKYSLKERSANSKPVILKSVTPKPLKTILIKQNENQNS